MSKNTDSLFELSAAYFFSLIYFILKLLVIVLSSLISVTAFSGLFSFEQRNKTDESEALGKTNSNRLS